MMISINMIHIAATIAAAIMILEKQGDGDTSGNNEKSVKNKLSRPAPILLFELNHVFMKMIIT